MKNLIFISFLLASPFVFGQSSDVVAAKSYMSLLSSQIVGRPLNASEINLIERGAERSFSQIVRQWVSSPEFLDSAQRYVEVFTRTSGQSGGVSYDLPGYIGRDIARRSRPYKELITANSCVDRNGNQTACDTGSPFSAGLLTTRAFLRTTKGAYNISRAGKMTSRFLCSTYPLPQSEEPKLDRAALVPEFATTSGEITFGNGNNCYSCHAQFGKHTQVFIKFNLDGTYVPSATGLQVTGATDGFSNNNLLTSHLRDPVRAQSERSEILGQPVQNLREAALVMANSQRFLPCAVQNMMRHFLRLSDQNMLSIKTDLYQVIANEAIRLRSEPSFSHLIEAIVTNANVYNSFKNSGARP